MASQALSYVLGVRRSITDRAWRWRGGNMALNDTSGGGDIVSQLLLARGVAHDDLARNRKVNSRAACFGFIV